MSYMIQSMINRNRKRESSECSGINFASDSVKRARHDEEMNNAAASLTFQKFKGVVPQQNGNWGAQIYANHQRIWLGTFKSEKEAAMAYDSASIKLRNGESHRNFPWNDETVQELKFQSHFSVETVLSMIRDGSYQSNFATFLITHQTQQGGGVGNKHITLKGEEQFYCTQLFQKELTPSDVGKLNRLVIPKKHAVTYFPYVCGNTTEGKDEESVDLEVVFYDKVMRTWKFRYCYWKSSQSYVFTRGWNRFVKEKKLKAKDVIAFFMCEPMDWRKGREGEAFALIDAIYNNEDATNESLGESRGEDIAKQALGNELACSEENEEIIDRKDQKGLRLFGVCIT